MRILNTITEYAEQKPCRTAEQMANICCEPADGLMCCEVARRWEGFSISELQDGRLWKWGENRYGEPERQEISIPVDGQGRDASGTRVVVELARRAQPCGEIITKYDIAPNNCCEDVEDISIDEEYTPDILPHGQSVEVFWHGGVPPFTVRTTSAGTSLAGGFREIVTGGDRMIVTASETFCGSTAVIVSDACSSAKKMLRSDIGQWLGDCYAYYWIAPRWGAHNNDVMDATADNCIYDCHSTTMTVSGYRGIVGTFRWSGGYWDTMIGYGSGGDGGCSQATPSAAWTAIQNKMEELQIPELTYPQSYAPNGPSDMPVPPGCSGAATCRWVC